MRDGRGVLDIFHKQTTSERGVKEREKLSRRALLAAAAAAAAVTAVTAVTAAALLGSHSAPETSVAAGLVKTVGASDPPVKAVGDGAVHDVDSDLDVRREALLTRQSVMYSKLKQFPALVTLLPKNGDLLLNGVMQIEGIAAHLDVEQAAWILIALLDMVCAGSKNSGAAYARVVARQRMLGTTGDDMDLALLANTSSVKEYVAAISASPITYDRVLAIAGALIDKVKGQFWYAYCILEIDCSLAVIARRVDHKTKLGAEEVARIVRIGCTYLPETMGALAIALDIKLADVKISAPNALVTGRFLVAAYSKHVFSDEDVKSMRVAHESLNEVYVGEAFIPDSIAFMSAHSDFDSGYGTLAAQMPIALDTCGPAYWLLLWQRHELVRTVVSSDGSRLELFLVEHSKNMDKVILPLHATEKTAIAGVEKFLGERPLGDVSIAIERAGVAALAPFLATIEAVVANHRLSSDIVRYCAALGRSGRRAASATDARTVSQLSEAWEEAPNSVLDAARYWNVSGKPLFDLLCAGAKWGRYEQISKMTNLFGDWTPDSANFVDVHARIVGAFFGLCERGEASDGDLMTRCWHCSESGTHDDAMVALVFRRKASAYSIATAVKEARSRGSSGIHGFLLVPGNGPTETSEGPKRWSNSPSVLHAEKVKLVASSVEPADVVRAVRMTPWLVTFVDPTSAIPMLLALITLVPECAAFLDPAQRGALESKSLFSSENLNEHIHASCAIVGSVSVVDDVRLWNARVHAALAELHALTSGNVLDRPEPIGWPEGGEEDKEVVLGEADIRRMLSSAYADQNRGVRGIETFIGTHVIGPLRRHSETNIRLFGLATALISEYNVLLKSRKIDAWAVPDMLVDTPRLVAFGKRRFV